MPNLRGASPVGHDGGGRSYAARANGGRTGLALSWSAASAWGEILCSVGVAGERAEHGEEQGVYGRGRARSREQGEVCDRRTCMKGRSNADWRRSAEE